MPFITITRALPGGNLDCLVNTEHVVWVQAVPKAQWGGPQSYLCMLAGEVLEANETYADVVKMFGS
jgi:hypothetical protein